LVEQDPELLVRAVECARSGGRLIDHAAACEDAATVLLGKGRTTDAVTFLTEAHDRYEAVGAHAWAARTASGLRRLGVRLGASGRRQRAAVGWESLSASERAVSRLVAEGLTNREIAHRLFISPHTVNTHLRHVFQKLSISTRTGLAMKVPTEPD
jgi:DNA-binding CsgD family transcriptional regulator